MVPDYVIKTAIRGLVWMARACGPSVIASRKRHSHRTSDRPQTSPGTSGRRTPLYGWKTSDSLVGLEERMMITSSCSTFPFLAPNTIHSWAELK
jgi:hypothetical protein